MNSTDIQIALVGNAPKEQHSLLNSMLDEEGLTDLCDIVLYGADGQPEYEALQDALDDYTDGQIQGIVCLPMAKPAEELVGRALEKSGETFAVLDNGIIRVGSVLTANNTETASKQLTSEAIQKRGKQLWRMLKRDLNVQNPRIAVLSVGDNVDVTDGSTDITVIAPAITEMVKEGIHAFGPVNAATFFASEKYKAYDAVLQMYGTQCTEAYRALTTESVITLIGGTETPIASAEAEGIYRALWAVIDMKRNRKEYDLPFANPLEKLYHERKEDGEKARFAVKKKGFNPAEHRRENVKFVTKNTLQQEQEAKNTDTTTK
ncbi:MAG: 4-hydroxythreonine-4-phosphate dehydrogenase PdxA [Prevotella sp.]|nr:4-hydroxythreonine-4-phosphate dehydrogenase PdxA [Prevotella sp.]